MADESRRRMTFLVEMDVSADATEADVREYLDEAAGSWCGSLRPPGGGYGDPSEPGDPLWGAECISVKNAARVAAGKRRGDRG